MNIIRKIIAYLFFPLSILYTLVVVIRNRAFDRGIIKQCKHNIPTIGVGNLSAGGTGKTPHVEYLARLLQKENYGRLALLSRGYKRKTKGFVLASPSSKVEDIGDEPYQMYCKLSGVNVAVCEDRNNGIQLIGKHCPDTNIILLDDVYQHRYVKSDILVLLTDFAHPFYTDRVIPFGNLREPRKGYKRADIIVVTKCPTIFPVAEQKKISAKIKPYEYQKVFFSYMEYGTPTSIDGKSTVSLNNITDVLLVTGIANPKPLADKVGQTCSVHLCRFADHHSFSRSDMEFICKQFLAIKAIKKIILTTEKDYVRIKSSVYRSIIDNLPIYYIPITIRFHKNVNITFDTEILRLVNSKNK